MYKRIMVAVDGSEIAQQALAEGVNIANTYNATLCIVHCIGGENDADKNKGNEILEKAKSDTNVLSVEIRLLNAEAEYGLNGIADAIAAAVYDWKADLIVVGTSNRRGLERFYVGSVAEQLVAKVDSSILLVRSK
ncbi:MAG: universal stress protein [Nitrosomonas sp.]|nr:universal stress protein [Nitrosomonas sp.]MCG7756753.1 universal stress protein [Nitrosomonas sp.]UJP00626.1 MAG: universal stress protein [Nitrosomonas sp.]UJP07967.1 MAG: universal stress protein [Nitrosomonas sp.]